MSLAAANTVSCFWWKNTAVPPKSYLKDYISKTELGEFSGVDDLPSLEEIVQKLWEANYADVDETYLENGIFINLYFVEDPTTMQAIISVPTSIWSYDAGNITVTYIYSKYQESESLLSSF
ncbi:hypothetical protein SCLARK_00590 [Spiroplasma clarkii]|uniref:hypothetical protein n=1 Tax=Spiroplasma clarkii TaxID=2139 RepID=UPI000B549A1F|nr:hypothetical protein [Spiroplasma clarkii]ARU91261.1 hypothetical protein SCLARK_00590 [Spiroplasma clarkii]